MIARNKISLQKSVKLGFWLCALIVAVEVLNILTGGMLRQYGVGPREISGLPGILTAPFIHGGIIHLASNLIPLMVFSVLLMRHGIVRFYMVFAGVGIMSGLLVWLFGRSANHIGMSGVIYGMFGYLLVAGFVSREFKLMLISLVVGVFYGGLIFGVLPTSRSVSFESHLFGLFSGIVLAFALGKAPKPLAE